ncbi:MAG: N-acetyl-alpha-D-glucosaminyl L-malate deacetylase 1 [candidate division WS2 bacterium]|uniref:N-acetyl-alpha-D-glucosaminyl L-malate deacetylase 1 n=1 Tax=Psychracetigena formicireducens TaxID=2986056 RepID=A0A9E2BEP5_PSYF1|nr:N-acetyl-alpha-D-glucosaminyl L-malate deacetylase 1 [Candidatus Psychracetigena formicireducens]MBT9144233.1 N-acetyl-alpha-D-glucosaminyl L-malate deacetylase 1 [Candidatus Psychracetigena formicireducens]MBT9150730.1 N-acetyl-alpha-D-glucosaminyl L-malate deacetylase 1 [Candidatus Psychracetigena formicireducens]
MKVKDLLPIPDIELSKKILAVQPHPDDLELFAGGTLAKMADKGMEITYITVTNGGYGTYDKNISPEVLTNIRKIEAKSASSLLGIAEHVFLEYTDSEVIDHKSLRNQLIHLIRNNKPEGIFLPDPWLPYEAHQGHVITGLAGAEAAIFSSLPHLEPTTPVHELKFIVFYATHRPNTYIDISSYWERKIEAIKCHKSQFNEDVFTLLSLYLSLKASEYGAYLDVEKAEAFKVLTPLHLHANTDSWDA